MTTTTAVLSGPNTTRGTLAAAVEGDVATGAHNWGLDAPKGHAWLTVRVTDLDGLAGLAEGMGWVLRLHFPTPAVPDPTPDPLADIMRRLDRLETGQ
jgi:hypothetical protein